MHVFYCCILRVYATQNPVQFWCMRVINALKV